MEPITTRVAKIYLDEHGFIRVDVNPGAEESFADAKHNMSMMAQTGQGAPSKPWKTPRAMSTRSGSW